jgi:hypothetical protein
VSQGGGADRVGDRPRVLACAAGVGGRKPEAELESALVRLIQSGLLSRQGVPPQASYLLKSRLMPISGFSRRAEILCHETASRLKHAPRTRQFYGRNLGTIAGLDPALLSGFRGSVDVRRSSPGAKDRRV